MNNFIQTNKKYELKRMLSIYQREANDNLAEMYMQAHDIVPTGNNGFTLGIGYPLEESVLYGLRSFLIQRQTRNEKKRNGILPKNLISLNTDSNRYVWFKAEHRSEIKFSDRKKALSVRHPNLIFVAEGDTLWVYAVATKTPKALTRLYHAPYLNMYSEGNFCKGDIKLSLLDKATTHEDLIAAWENLFFNSRFGGGLGDDVKFKAKKPFETMAKAKTFPYKLLVPFNKKANLKSLIQ